jgi:hypothetical protein
MLPTRPDSNNAPIFFGFYLFLFIFILFLSLNLSFLRTVDSHMF